METLIKESGLAEIKTYSKEGIETYIRELALDANRHLLNAAYSESLIPSVEAQIETYQNEIKTRDEKIAALDLSTYEAKKQEKEIRKGIKAYENGIKKLEERIKNAREKITSLRYDAQANMHRIAFLKDLTPDAPAEQLKAHIEALQKKAEPEAEATA